MKKKITNPELFCASLPLVRNIVASYSAYSQNFCVSGNTPMLESHLSKGLTPVYVYRIGELEEQLDNKDKEQREIKLKADERIRILEKKYVFLINNKIKISPHIYVSDNFQLNKEA